MERGCVAGECRGGTLLPASIGGSFSVCVFLRVRTRPAGFPSCGRRRGFRFSVSSRGSNTLLFFLLPSIQQLEHGVLEWRVWLLVARPTNYIFLTLTVRMRVVVLQ